MSVCGLVRKLGSRESTATMNITRHPPGVSRKGNTLDKWLREQAKQDDKKREFTGKKIYSTMRQGRNSGKWRPLCGRSGREAKLLEESRSRPAGT